MSCSMASYFTQGIPNPRKDLYGDRRTVDFASIDMSPPAINGPQAGREVDIYDKATGKTYTCTGDAARAVHWSLERVEKNLKKTNCRLILKSIWEEQNEVKK